MVEEIRRAEGGRDEQQRVGTFVGLARHRLGVLCPADEGSVFDSRERGLMISAIFSLREAREPTGHTPQRLSEVSGHVLWLEYEAIELI